MSGIKRKIYCDSCIFISYLNNEVGTADIVEYIAREFDTNKIIIIASALFRVEVLDPISEENAFSFENLAGRDNFQEITIDRDILEKTRELRIESKSLKSTTLATSDAIHLATANIQQVDQLYTFDNDFIAACKGLTSNSIPVGKPIKPTFNLVRNQ